jgi:hypothetical protein
MSPNQENFEKLEAYIDGALDEPSRMEMERQIALNPQLKRMVAELSMTRDWVRALPLAKAPPEVIETFQGQLERAALLGDDGPGERDVIARIDRWPQFMSVAAIVLLAAGLAMVVYTTLPKGPPAKIAMGGNSPTTATVAGPAGAAGERFARQEKGIDEIAAKGDETIRAKKEAFGEATEDRRKDVTASALGSVAESRAYERKMTVAAAEAERSGGAKAGVDGAAGVVAQKPGLAEPESYSKEGMVAGKGGLVRGGAAAANGPADRPQVSGEELARVQRQMSQSQTAFGAGGFGGGRAAGRRALDAYDGNNNNNNEAAQEQPVLMVLAQDPQLADQDVADYLNKNQIKFDKRVAALGANFNYYAPTYGVGYAQSNSSGNNGNSLTVLPYGPTIGLGAGGGNATDNIANFRNNLGNSANATANSAINSGIANNVSNGQGLQQQEQVRQQQERQPGSMANARAGLQNAPQNVELRQQQPAQQGQPQQRGAGEPALAEASNLAVTTPTNAAATSPSNGIVAGANVYLVRLTTREESELNAYLGRRANQTTVYALASAGGAGANGNANEDGAAVDQAKSQAPAPNQSLEQQKVMRPEAGGQNAAEAPKRTEGATPPAPAPMPVPALDTKQNVTSPAAATAATPAPAAAPTAPTVAAPAQQRQELQQQVAVADRGEQPVTFQLRGATTQEVLAKRSQVLIRARMADKLDQEADALSATRRGAGGGGGRAAADYAPATQPLATTQPATQPARMARELAAPAQQLAEGLDEPHEVIIVVNDQPVVVPNGAATTAPAGGPAAPAEERK